MASHPITLTRKELYDKVWSQPVHTLAKEYGISDVGLKKICKRRDIPTPALATGPRLRTRRPFVLHRFLPPRRNSRM